MKLFKVGDHVWVQAGHRSREAVIMRLFEQSADVCFVLTQTYCCVPLSTMRPVEAFAIMGENDESL